MPLPRRTVRGQFGCAADRPPLTLHTVVNTLLRVPSQTEEELA